MTLLGPGLADEEDSVLGQRGQLQLQPRRSVVEVGRLVAGLLPVLQDEVEDAARVEMPRVERRAGPFGQDKLVRLDEVVDATGNAAGHHGYPDIEHDVQPPHAKVRDHLQVGGIERAQVGERSIVLVRDPAFVDVPLREVLRVNPLRRSVDPWDLDPLHDPAHPRCGFHDEHDLAVNVAVGGRNKQILRRYSGPEIVIRLLK